MSKQFALSDVLNSYSLGVSHDGYSFALKPFSVEQVDEWNDLQTLEPKKSEKPRDYAKRSRGEQLRFLASHFQNCLTEGDEKAFSTDWVKKLPEPLLVDLIPFFTTGKKPAFASEAEEKN